jgi:uncharacterized protein with HEPN domain
MRRDVERLSDILDAINLIEVHGADARVDFDGSVVIRYFCLKQVEIIGEAVFKLSDEIKGRHPDVPWKKIERTRHIWCTTILMWIGISSGTFFKSTFRPCEIRLRLFSGTNPLDHAHPFPRVGPHSPLPDTFSNVQTCGFGLLDS